jgi:hypothetical protein
LRGQPFPPSTSVPGSFDKRRELAIRVRDHEVLNRLVKIVHDDWEHSHPIDLTDDGLLSDLKRHPKLGSLARAWLDDDRIGGMKRRPSTAFPYAAFRAILRSGLRCPASFFLELNTLHWTVPMGTA